MHAPACQVGYLTVLRWDYTGPREVTLESLPTSCRLIPKSLALVRPVINLAPFLTLIAYRSSSSQQRAVHHDQFSHHLPRLHLHRLIRDAKHHDLPAPASRGRPPDEQEQPEACATGLPRSMLCVLLLASSTSSPAPVAVAEGEAQDQYPAQPEPRVVGMGRLRGRRTLRASGRHRRPPPRTKSAG